MPPVLMLSALRKLRRSYITLLQENGNKPILKKNIASNLDQSKTDYYLITSHNYPRKINLIDKQKSVGKNEITLKSSKKYLKINH